MTTHGTTPTIDPKMKGRNLPLPGVSYFSCSAPNMIMAALAAKIENRAAMSVMPVIWAISQIMIEELREYSTQRK